MALTKTKYTKVFTTDSGRFRAEVWDNRAKRNRVATHPTLKAALAWQRDTAAAVATGTLTTPASATVREVYAQWLDLAERGVARARGGALYKPGVIVSYRQAFTGRLLAAFGARKVAELRRRDVQAYVDELVAEGLAAQTIRNMVTALRVVLNHAAERELILVNPVIGVRLPSGGETRDNIVAPAEAERLLGLLANEQDRAIYATAFYAGLRRGELMALRWDSVHFASRTLLVNPSRGSYDPRARQFVAPKSKRGSRRIGMPARLIPYLEAIHDGQPPAALVFPSAAGTPFQARELARRARDAWGDDHIGLHVARHTFASIAIAAGANLKAVSEAMGHSGIQITVDRYGHLLPGSQAVMTGLLDDYLDAA